MGHNYVSSIIYVYMYICNLYIICYYDINKVYIDIYKYNYACIYVCVIKHIYVCLYILTVAVTLRYSV